MAVGFLIVLDVADRDLLRKCCSVRGVCWERFGIERRRGVQAGIQLGWIPIALRSAHEYKIDEVLQQAEPQVMGWWLGG